MKQIEFILDVYSGPLELLLHLIGKNKVSIYDIPISEITEQYFVYMSQMRRYDIELSSEFLVMAATLLHIKSKMILPKTEEDPEEDPRLELAERLALYRRIKFAAEYMRGREFYGAASYTKPQEFISPVIIDESMKTVTAVNLQAAMRSLYELLIRKKPVERKSFEGIVGHDPIPVHEKVSLFLQRIVKLKNVLFKDLFKGIKSRDEAVASFLAILELIKMNKIVVSDDNGDLYVKRKG